MKKIVKLSVIAFVTVALASLSAQATITVTHQYTFEDGTAGNQIVPTMTDSVGTSHMSKLTGAAARYSSTVPGLGTSSTLSADFSIEAPPIRYDTSSFALWGTATDNFGMEAWIQPLSATGNQSILVNGYNTGVQGIYQVGSEYHMMLDGTLYDFNAAISSLGTWDHVAMVRDSGVATLYVNGVAIGNTSAAVSGTPNIHSFIGDPSPGYTTGGGSFVGRLDTVRYFTFTAGAFEIGDLDFPAAVPEPSTALLLLVGGAIAYRKLRRV